LVQPGECLYGQKKPPLVFQEVKLETNLLSGRDFDYFYISTTVNVSELEGTSLEETSLEETPKTVQLSLGHGKLGVDLFVHSEPG
jgi:hypothetical protein